MTESEAITQATQVIRSKEISLRKKYPFGLKFTYWDADDLLMQMKSDGIEYMTINRTEGDIVVTSNPNFRHPEKFTVRPDQLVEMFVMSVDVINKMMLVHKTFVEEGGAQMSGLTSPGIDDMEKFCRGVDDITCRAARDLKKNLNMDNIFRKIWIEMGGESARKDDIVARRIDYISKLGVLYRKDRMKWASEMKSVGLV